MRVIRSDEDRWNRPGDVTPGFRGDAQGITLITVQGLQKLYGAREVLHGLDLTVRLAGDLVQGSGSDRLRTSPPCISIGEHDDSHLPITTR